MGAEENVAVTRTIMEQLRIDDDPSVERPYGMTADRAGEYRTAVDPLLDLELELEIDTEMPAGMKQRYEGPEGWWEFWLSWVEEWDEYRFSMSELEPHRDEVVFNVDITAKGRTSGVPVAAKATHVWSIRSGRLRRCRVFFSRRKALAAVEDSEGE